VTLTLRDYQLGSYNGVRAAAAAVRRVCLVIPTGGGKTRVGTFMSLRAAERSFRVAWLTHRTELLDQAADAHAAAGLEVGTIGDRAERPPNPAAAVQICSIQTLVERGLRPDADLVIVDEFHRFAAPTFAAKLAEYPAARIVGLTATPERSDGLGLGTICDRLVVGARIGELVAAGHLVPANLIRPPERLRSGVIAERPVDAYLAYAAGLRCVVFSSTVAVAEKHASEFAARGISVATISGESDPDFRREAFRRLRSGELQVLCNVNVAVEGVDVPEIGAVILARSFGSGGAYLQAIGRALRPVDGKEAAVIVDLTGASHIHGHPEEDRLYSLEGTGIRRASDAAGLAYCRVCSAPLPPGVACAECGTAPREQKAPRVVHAPLELAARRQAQGVDHRARNLARWIAEGRARGYKSGRAFAIYAGFYKAKATPDVILAARALLHAQPAGDPELAAT
jgi:DNA repair protein RadD